MISVSAVIGVVLGIAFGQLLSAIATYLWRRWQVPNMRARLKTEVLSQDGPIQLKTLDYHWSGYDCTLQWDDIDRIATTRRRRLRDPQMLMTFVHGVQGGVFIATATGSPGLKAAR